MITRDRLEGRDDLEALWQAPAAAPAPDHSGSPSMRTGMWWAYEAVAFGSLGAASVVATRAVGR